MKLPGLIFHVHLGITAKLGHALARGIYTKAWVMGSCSFTPESLPLFGDMQPLQDRLPECLRSAPGSSLCLRQLSPNPAA